MRYLDEVSSGLARMLQHEEEKRTTTETYHSEPSLLHSRVTFMAQLKVGW